jgi:hypothetical protein
MTRRERGIVCDSASVLTLLDSQQAQVSVRVTIRNALVNGWPPVRHKADVLESWHTLRFTEAWTDGGPSPAGNRGPYLKVPGLDDSVHRVYSRVQPGDRLWVRETWGLLDTQPVDGPKRARIFYRATDGERRDLRYQLWRSPRVMPRWASRLRLEVTQLRCVHLESINGDDIPWAWCYALRASDVGMTP